MSTINIKSALLVEDTDSHALLIKRALRTSVETVTHVKSLGEAREFLAKNTVDIVVTDLMLPDSRGSETVAGLIQTTQNLPLIVLTSSSDLTEAVTAMRAGAKDFLVKTFDRHFEELLGLAVRRVGSLALLERERARFEQETKALRAAVELGAEPVVIVDGIKGEIVYHNAAYELLSLKVQAGTQSLFDLFKMGPPKKAQLVEDLTNCLQTLPLHAVWTANYSTNLPNFGSYDLSLSVVPSAESSRTVVVWFRDVTDVEARERFQKDLIATTTHDLKNPLGVISISSELLTPLVANLEKPAKLVLRIASSAQTALNLVDEFLSARRIDEGSFVLKPTPNDVVALLNEALMGFETVVKARSLTLVTQIIEGSLEWRVDGLAFQRVVTNLVSNAAKFTKSGGTISVSLKHDDERLYLEVKDTGSGMEASEVGRLFERFKRLRQHANVPGTGLGLFIVKTIVNGHGGDISVRSQLDVGTSFTISFPQEPALDADGEIKIITV